MFMASGTRKARGPALVARTAVFAPTSTLPRRRTLLMITKAGVPSNKVLVGVSSYGQSFRMSDPSCMGPTYFFTGLKSGAAKWECTDTAGYIANAEVNRIIQNNPPRDEAVY